MTVSISANVQKIVAQCSLNLICFVCSLCVSISSVYRDVHTPYSLVYERWWGGRAWPVSPIKSNATSTTMSFHLFFFGKLFVPLAFYFDWSEFCASISWCERRAVTVTQHRHLIIRSRHRCNSAQLQYQTEYFCEANEISSTSISDNRKFSAALF